MKRINYLALLVGFTIVVMTSCSKQGVNERNDIAIEFMSPSNGALVDGKSVNVQALLTATESLNDVEFVLYPKNDQSNKVMSIQMQGIEMERNINEFIDLSSFPSGTVFVMEVLASRGDDDDDDHGDDDDDDHGDDDDDDHGDDDDDDHGDDDDDDHGDDDDDDHGDDDDDDHGDDDDDDHGDDDDDDHGDDDDDDHGDEDDDYQVTDQRKMVLKKIEFTIK